MIDLIRETREQELEPTRQEIAEMELEEIENAVNYFLYAKENGWNRITKQQENLIEMWKENPYFKELISEDRDFCEEDDPAWIEF